MPVCKFYQEGCCKFGERCRFEHPGSGNGSTGSKQNHKGSHFYYSSYFRNSNRGYYNHYNDTQDKGQVTKTFSNHKDDKSQANKNHDKPSDNHYQGQEKEQGSASQNNKNPTKTHLYSNPDDVVCTTEPRAIDEIMAAAEEDMDEWRNSSMWLLTSYGFGKEQACVEGFIEFSPEEMRAKYMEAERNGKLEEHIKWCKRLKAAQKQKRELFIQPQEAIKPLLETLMKRVLAKQTEPKRSTTEQLSFGSPREFSGQPFFQNFQRGHESSPAKFIFGGQMETPSNLPTYFGNGNKASGNMPAEIEQKSLWPRSPWSQSPSEQSPWAQSPWAQPPSAQSSSPWAPSPWAPSPWAPSPWDHPLSSTPEKPVTLFGKTYPSGGTSSQAMLFGKPVQAADRPSHPVHQRLGERGPLDYMYGMMLLDKAEQDRLGLQSFPNMATYSTQLTPAQVKAFEEFSLGDVPEFQPRKSGV